MIKKRCVVFVVLFVAVFQTDRIYSQIVLPSGFSDQVMVDSLNSPVGFTWDANGNMYVWEKRGRVIMYDTNLVKQFPPFINIQSEVANFGDHGLLSFALHPDYLNNHLVYLGYTVDRHHLMYFGTPQYYDSVSQNKEATIMRLTRYQANPVTQYETVDTSTRTVLIGSNKLNGIPVLHQSHGAGTLLFGTDTTLIWSVGDGASFSMVDTGGGNPDTTYAIQALGDSIIDSTHNVGAFRVQMLDCMAGKILRIDPMTGAGIPSNPYFDTLNPSSAQSRIWAMGLRNPYRITMRPNSGSSNFMDGDPGDFYIGDVGYSTWEEINICDAPGLNFGWPLFEGLTQQNNYMNSEVLNKTVPNPLLGIGGCTEEFFRFKDLLKHATLDTTNYFPNPCDSNQQIPDSIETWVHHRPVFDWKHEPATQSRMGVWNGNDAAEIDLNDVACPIPAVFFGGDASVAGTWYDDNRFPSEYHNTYFHLDYVRGWIKNFGFDSLNNPTFVKNFADSTGPVVFLTLNKRDGCLWYVKYGLGPTSEIRRICYDYKPVAVIIPDTAYGPDSLTVNFDGSNSYDPRGLTLTYFWEFGDGNTSTLMNPAHTYYIGSNQPVLFYAKLTVTNDSMQTATDSVIVSLNNTPPQVSIISPVDSSLYSVSMNELFNLQANVFDAEHGPDSLFYSWVVVLHHNSHNHPEEPDTNKISSFSTTPTPCDSGVTYYFRVYLTVTDYHGLSTTVYHTLYPNCLHIGMEELNEPDPAIVIAPNPVQNGMLGFSFHNRLKSSQKIFCELRNMLGEKVKSSVIEAGNSENSFQIHVSGFSKGVYLLTLKSESFVLSKRFMID